MFLEEAATRFKAQSMAWHTVYVGLAMSSSKSMASPVSSSNYTGENHQWKIKTFIFYREFLAHSTDLDSFHCPARSHRLSYNNCRAGLWGTAGLQQECRGCHSIRAGYMALGRCGRNVTEKAAAPSPPSQECNVTSLEPLPARQRGHPVAPPRRTSLSALKWLPRRKKQPFCLRKSDSEE